MESVKKTLIITIFLVLLSNFVSAGFVCGEVDDAENISANWFNVRIYQAGYFGDFATCEVSPSDKKYCCDPEAIESKTWEIGDTIYAEIYNNQTDYYASAVSIVTTGAGYDILPTLKLENVISINSPKKKLIISNESFFNLNLTAKKPYSNLILFGENSSDELCTDCTNFSKVYNTSFGTTKRTLHAVKNGYEYYSKEIKVTILKEINYSKELSCDTCFEDSIKTNNEAMVKINLNFSDPVDELELKEYVPKDFEIIDLGEAQLINYSEDYNLLIWNVSGNNSSKYYGIKAPNVFLFPKKYDVKTEIEDLSLENKSIIVHRFFKFWATVNEFNKSSNSFYKKSYVSPSRPLVLTPNSSYISLVAVYTTRPRFTSFNMSASDTDLKVDSGEEYFSFETPLNKSEIDKISVEIKVNKTLEENFKIILYSLEENEWVRKDLNLSKESEEFNYYLADVQNSNGLAISKEDKRSFVEKVVDFFS